MICKTCGKEHDGSYGSGIFCCRSCANSRKHTKLTKNKISSKLKGRCKDKYCKFCGKLIEGNSRKKFCSDNCKILYRHINTFEKYFGFDKDFLGTIEVFDNIDKIREELYRLYWIEHKSSTEICNIYNYPNVGNLTAKVFKTLGIDIKNNREASIENIEYNRIKSVASNNIYKSAIHLTWNCKEVYLRSSYELDYAKQLDEKKVDYEVESLRIKYYDTIRKIYRIAIPDFYIKETNTIVEIKSSYTFDRQNIIDKFDAYKSQGYAVKLILDKHEITL